MRDPGSDGAGWRSRLYEAYVSSGQAAMVATDCETTFASRLPWLRAVVRRYLPDDRAARILDLGCGHGAFLYVLRQMGFSNVSGVDVSREQVEAAARLGIRGVGLSDALEHVETLEQMSVDVVLSMDLLEHLPGATLLALAENVRRILRSDGRWVLHVPNAEGLFGAGVRYGDLTHHRAFTPSSVRQLCRTAGFERVEIHRDPPVVHGAASLLRRIVWGVGEGALRLLFTAETGRLDPVLTRNLLAVAHP